MISTKNIVVLSLIFVLCVLASQAFALQTPRQLAEESSQKILALLNDPAFKNPATKMQVRAQLEAEVLNLFDFEEFSSRAIGPSWRQFNPEQKQRFIAAFTNLLRNSYIDTLDSYNGQTISYVGEVSSDNGTRVEMRMSFNTGDTKYPVAFRMLVKNDRWVVYDVLIEGISMIKTYRDQFKELLAKGNPDSLITMVEKKAEEEAQKQKK